MTPRNAPSTRTGTSLADRLASLFDDAPGETDPAYRGRCPERGCRKERWTDDRRECWCTPTDQWGNE